MRRPKETKPDAPKLPGAFTSDGGWNSRAYEGERGHVDGLTRALVKARQNERLTPSRASEVIRAANAGLAFPNADQWAACQSWPLARTSTSAEQFVVREGGGPMGHWCGERWAPGTERDCQDERHRSRPNKEQAMALAKKVLDALGPVPEVVIYEEEDP